MTELALELMRHAAIGVVGGVVILWLLGLGFEMRSVPTQSQSGTAHVFTFRDRQLIATSPAAERALNLRDWDDNFFEQLVDRLSGIFPDLREKLEHSMQTGIGFRLSELSIEGPAEVIATLTEDTIELSIEGLRAPMASKVLVDADRNRADEAELRILRGIADADPVAVWRESASGKIDWTNRSYAQLVDLAGLENTAQDDGFSRLFESSSVTKPGEAAARKRSHLETTSGETRWFDVSSFGQSDATLHFAVDARPTIKAEENLRNLTQTLTQTFAYLPIGLAIFDRARHLVMFNPALLDLTYLEPVWLSCRPTLYDFLNRLREKRMVPERRDFSDWRKKLEHLEQRAVEGSYCETWTLPTGQTYRVTGRPHPEGAIAFLFEDISAEISLTRKFRQELDLSQSMFDSFPEAIAIFSSYGTISMSNAAYNNLIGSDPVHALGDVSVVDASKDWQALCKPSPIWGDVRDFIVQKGERAEWNSTVETKDGRMLDCRFVPISHGATLIGFSEACPQTVSEQPDPAMSLMTG